MFNNFCIFAILYTYSMPPRAATLSPGNAYESNSQFEEAKAAYQVFVDKFPDHFMAEQTRKMIPLVGMSPEEMLDKILDDANNSIIAQ